METASQFILSLIFQSGIEVMYRNALLKRFLHESCAPVSGMNFPKSFMAWRSSIRL